MKSSSALIKSGSVDDVRQELVHFRAEMFRQSNRATKLKTTLLAVKFMVSRLDVVGTVDILRRIDRGLEDAKGEVVSMVNGVWQMRPMPKQGDNPFA